MGQSREVTASLGSGFATTDMVLNIGPQHPATHGVLRLRLTLDGERVVHCEPIIGYMHRGVEKLFEVRDYRQIIVLANRHDWLSAFSSELGVALAVEDMLGMEVPERATWIRTLLAELNRVLNHLMFLGSYPLELGAITPIFYAFRERETLQEVMEEVSGGRMHYMFNRVGGLKEDIPAGWTGRASDAVAAVRRRLNEIEDLVLGNEIFAARTKGVGVLTPELVHAYGVSGPIARASGVDVDLRRDEPYLAYAELADTLRVPTRTDGDCYSRFSVLLEQAKVSLDLADACLDRLGQLAPGPVNVRLPKIVKAPEGSHLRLDREPARAQRLLPRLAWREDAVATEAAHRVVQQRGGAAGDRRRLRGGRPGGGAGLDVLRRRRHRQVGHRVNPCPHQAPARTDRRTPG